MVTQLDPFGGHRDPSEEILSTGSRGMRGLDGSGALAPIIIVIVVLSALLFYVLLTIANEHFSEYFGQEIIPYCTDSVLYEPTPRPPPRPGTIFVSIASYRDQECSGTLNSLFEGADDPGRIFVGICEQNRDPSEFCYDDTDTLKPHRKQIRYHNVPWHDAAGPTKARYLASKLWQGEEYFFQIDSHTTFEKGWDTALVGMLEACGTESLRPVLSTYPPTAAQISEPGFPVFDNGKALPSGLMMFLAGVWTGLGVPPRPVRSPKPFISGGLFFARSTFLYDVQYDPLLGHLFQGEELLFSARMFTNGYDIFTPNLKVISHHYGRTSAPLFHQGNTLSAECRGRAEQKVRFLLGLSDKTVGGPLEEFMKDIDRYGLGTYRALEDFWNAAGVTVKDKKIVEVEYWGEHSTPSERFRGWNFYLSGYERIKKWVG